MSMLERRADDYMSAVDVPAYMRFREVALGAGNPLQVELYATGGLYAHVVDKPADDAVARGVRIMVEGGGENGDKDFQDELDRLMVLPALAEACRWSRLMGGGCIVVMTDVGGSVAAPLDVAQNANITELRVYGIDEVSVDNRYGDFMQSTFGRPETYLIKEGAGQFLVHESRIIPIPGDPLPGRTRRGIPWRGRPMVDRVYEKIGTYDAGLRWANLLLQKKQQPVFRMNGLTEALSGATDEERARGKSIIQDMVGMTDAKRNALNTTVVDFEDEYRVQDLSLTGVPEIIQQYMIGVSAECSIPVSILFGRSATGLNATGEADFRGYYDLVDSIQRRKLTPALERLLALIEAQPKFTRKTPGTWRIEWPALSQPTGKEQAEIEKIGADRQVAEATAIEKLVTNGVISAEVAHDYLRRGKNVYDLKPGSTAPEEPDPLNDPAVQAVLNAGTTQTPRPAVPGRH